MIFEAAAGATLRILTTEITCGMRTAFCSRVRGRAWSFLCQQATVRTRGERPLMMMRRLNTWRRLAYPSLSASRRCDRHP